MNKHLTILAVITFIAPLITSPTYAEESTVQVQAPAAEEKSPAVASDKSAETETKTDNKSAAKKKSATATSPKFNPSEEISEDLSVPFPVDI